jgi:hypothetical protein
MLPCNKTVVAVLTNITTSGAGLGWFSYSGDSSRSLDINKIFDSVNPIALEFTVAHDTGPGNPYNITEHIMNNTGIPWTDFYFIITGSGHGSGIVFTKQIAQHFPALSLRDQANRVILTLSDHWRPEASYRIVRFKLIRSRHGKHHNVPAHHNFAWLSGVTDTLSLAVDSAMRTVSSEISSSQYNSSGIK